MCIRDRLIGWQRMLGYIKANSTAHMNVPIDYASIGNCVTVIYSSFFSPVSSSEMKGPSFPRSQNRAKYAQEFNRRATALPSALAIWASLRVFNSLQANFSISFLP
eukprot:TRINITY_DN46893_c0_g1_i1.p1 TRINITY_DN46893_c0_g1~~TRINITY_DN46893_c0_g1_i1.p1  ORF type:complete len:106 (+),score=3.34 TRINITY_DN46893_c0_g1_i1:168-485(+)